jgi:hypothetical protein
MNTICCVVSDWVMARQPSDTKKRTLTAEVFGVKLPK